MKRCSAGSSYVPGSSWTGRPPAADRIAREGVLFRRAYVNSPSCTPCRSSLLSGQYFWRTGRGAILQGAVWDSKIPSFPLLLHEAGYHIGQTYKVWSPGTPNDAPFGGEKFAYEKAGGRFNNFSENCTQMVKKGQPLDDAKAGHIASASTPCATTASSPGQASVSGASMPPATREPACGEPRSDTETEYPARAAASATDRPMTPPPRTVTSTLLKAFTLPAPA